MVNEYYIAPADKVPLTTIRSSVRNADAQSVEDGFDLLPTIAELSATAIGTDVSTLNTLYEITVSTLPTPVTAGFSVQFKALLSSSAAPQISVNGTTIVEIVDNSGAAIVADAMKAGRMMRVVFDGTNYQLVDAIVSGSDLVTSGAPSPNDYARFTSATAVEGRTFAEVRVDLGLVIGTDVQAQSAVLDDLDTLGPPTIDAQVLISTGAGAFAYETGQTFRASVGIDDIGQAEAEAGIATIVRGWTSQRVAQAITAQSIPAGQLQFVANGAIAAGKPVILDAAGTVQEIVGAVFSEVSAQVAAIVSKGWSAVYDPDTDRVIAVYEDDTAADLMCVVCDFTGATPTFGTPVVVDGTSTAGEPSITYDTNLNRVVIVYQTISADPIAIVGTVTTGPDTITFGATTTVHTGSILYSRCTFDETTGKVIVTYKDTGIANDPVLGNVGTVTTGPDAITFGAQLSISTDTPTSGDDHDVKYDPDSNNTLVVWENAANGLEGAVLTVSGTTLSVAGTTTLDATTMTSPRISHNSDENAMCVAYKDSTTAIKGIALTISVTTITAGTPVSKTGVPNMTAADPIGTAYDSTAKKVATLVDSSSTEGFNLLTFSVSGTVVTWDSDVNEITDGTSAAIGVDVIFLPNELEIACFWGDNTETVEQTAKVVTPFSNLTATDLVIGISAEAAIDTASLAVTVPGGVSTNQSGLTFSGDLGTFWVDADGTLQNSDTGFQQIGTAPSATELILVEGWRPS